jgi:hypothetical protein
MDIDGYEEIAKEKATASRNDVEHLKKRITAQVHLRHDPDPLR